MLEEYTLNIRHIPWPGKRNVMADALSKGLLTIVVTCSASSISRSFLCNIFFLLVYSVVSRLLY